MWVTIELRDYNQAENIEQLLSTHTHDFVLITQSKPFTSKNEYELVPLYMQVFKL